MARKIHFRDNWLIFLGILGEAELFLRIWGAKENTFRELRNFLLGIWGDQCIVFRDQGEEDKGELQRREYNIVWTVKPLPFQNM